MPDWMRERYDTMEVLDAVLSVVGSNPRPRDMVVDYVKRLHEQNRDMDEYYADEAAGVRGFHDAGEMDAYDNMREREAAGFHDVAAAGREADGARADLLADAQARLNDPNASEYEKQAARTVLRFRQRGEEAGGGIIMFRVRDIDKLSQDERRKIRKSLEETKPIVAQRNSIVARDGVSARNVAMEWAAANLSNPLVVNTEIGDLVINKKSISDSLAHGFGQAKLDAIPTILPAFKEKHAVYIGSAEDINGDPITDHYFAYPIDYNGDKNYVFCRTREDQNTHRLYIHEVITEDDIAKGQTLQSTALEKPRTGLPLYRKIMLTIFGDKGSDNISSTQENVAKTTESGGVSQGFGSAATSLNQVASAMRKIDWKPGTVNVDIGGGRFDKATEYLREQGVESMVFDPFNRDAEHNRQVAERVRDEKVDTVTCNNVLNVIDSASSRANVILQAAKALKPGGTAYFSVYEGDKSGVGRQTKSDSWQNNRVTKDYVSEIERYFDDVTVKDKVIIAKNPKATTEQSVWDFDGKYSGNDVRFRHRAPNGKESRLDERQYDEVRTGNFKRWFGDWENDQENASKVVDANGEPLVVYHQTNSKQYINRETGQNWDDSACANFIMRLFRIANPYTQMRSDYKSDRTGTSGRERLSSIQKMPLLWEKSAEPSATDAVSANVTSELPNENGRANGSASNQSNGIGGKGSENSADGQMDGGETTNFRVRDGRHGSAGIEEPHGEHSGHEAAGRVRFRVREAGEPLTGEAGLLGLTCGCEHCIVAQMLFRGEDVVAGWSGENNMAQGPRSCAPCAIVCLYLIGFRLPGRSGICCRDNDIICGSA